MSTFYIPKDNHPHMEIKGGDRFVDDGLIMIVKRVSAMGYTVLVSKDDKKIDLYTAKLKDLVANGTFNKIEIMEPIQYIKKLEI